MKLLYKMYSIFVNSEISTSYDPHRLLLDFYRIKQTKKGDKFVHLSNLGIYFTWQNMQKIIQKQESSGIKSNVEY